MMQKLSTKTSLQSMLDFYSEKKFVSMLSFLEKMEFFQR